MASAQDLGAQCKTQATFISASIAEGAAEMPWRIRYRQHGQEHTCTAAVVVNAAGPWANEVLRHVGSPTKPLAVELVQGTHLVLDGKLQQGIYYLESPRDQRPVFVMPWRLADESARDAILLGTTETRFTGNPAEAQPLPEEQAYLLETYRHYFSAAPHVRAAFAGLRVLPVAEDQADGSLGARQRETVLHADHPEAPRLLTIYGGKLTAYRATAEKVMRVLKKTLPDREPVADTRALILRAVD
jgi:glycerol-3-phosphate dehydrogenase